MNADWNGNGKRKDFHECCCTEKGKARRRLSLLAAASENFLEFVQLCQQQQQSLFIRNGPLLRVIKFNSFFSLSLRTLQKGKRNGMELNALQKTTKVLFHSTCCFIKTHQASEQASSIVAIADPRKS